MAIEDNNPIGEIDPSTVQTDMSVPAEPVDIQVEGQEIPVEEEPKEDSIVTLQKTWMIECWVRLPIH
jgi:hypothetical protein